MQRALLLIAFTAALGACAFKDKSQNLSVVPSQPAQAPGVDGQPDEKLLPHLALEWDDKEKGNKDTTFRKLTHTSPKIWSTQNPFTLPRPVPKDLTLQIKLESDFHPTEVHATMNLKAPDGARVDLGSMSFGVTDLADTYEIRLKDLDRAFADGSGLPNYVTLKTQTQEGVSEIQFALILAPNELKIEQAPLAEFIKQKGTYSFTVTPLNRVHETLHLLQVARIKNPHPFRVEMNLPLHLKGKLLSHSTSLSEHVSQCSHTISRSDFQMVYLDSFTLIPIIPGLSKSFGPFLDQARTAGSYFIEIEAGGTRDIGIYGSGKALNQLVEEGHPVSRFETSSVPGSCVSRCSAVNQGTWDFVKYWANRQRGNEVRACLDPEDPLNRNFTRVTFACFQNTPNPPPNEDLCNNCRDFDEARPPNTHSQGFFCTVPWTITVKRVEVVLGNQTDPVFLELDEMTNQGLISFKFQGVGGEDEPHILLRRVFKSHIQQME